MIPLNAVARVGEETLFNCSTHSPPTWIFSKGGTSRDELVIATGCNVTIGLGSHYRTEEQGSNSTTTCNLIVFGITMRQAGVYRCTENITYYALLTVIGKLYTQLLYNIMYM